MSAFQKRIVWMLICVLGGLMGLSERCSADDYKKKSLYRWTDAQGIIHYGDALPPAAAKQEREVLQGNGRVKSVLPRELTSGEAAAQEAEAKLRRAQEAHDRSLLLTYTNVAGLNNARSDHLAAIDRRIDQEQSAIGDGRAQIAKLMERASAPKLSNEEAAELSSQIYKRQQEAAGHQKNIEMLQQERAQIDQQFNEDIARFQALKSGVPIGSR